MRSSLLWIDHRINVDSDCSALSRLLTHVDQLPAELPGAPLKGVRFVNHVSDVPHRHTQDLRGVFDRVELAGQEPTSADSALSIFSAAASFLAWLRLIAAMPAAAI